MKLINLFTALFIFWLSFTAVGKALAADPPTPGHFVEIKGISKAKKIQFNLQKVDILNRERVRSGLLPIRYQAYELAVPVGRVLDFRFFDLDDADFYAVAAAYGQLTSTEPLPGRHDYNLVDFMPPVIQALNLHYFKNAATKVEAINRNRNGSYLLNDPNGNIDDRVTTCVNCWATAYGVVQNIRSPDTFTVFYVDRDRATRFFESFGEPVTSGEPSTGDVGLIMTQRQLYRDVEVNLQGEIRSKTPSSKVQILEHAFIHIDENLVFEKSNSGDLDPFRFITRQEAAKPYWGYHGKVQYRRIAKSIRSQTTRSFGGQLQDHSSATDPRWSQPLPEFLRRMLIMNRELMFPEEGNYYNTWNQIVDVPLIRDNESGRYRLSAQAYRAETFDAELNAKSCERLLIK